MIPESFIESWSEQAEWQTPAMVEQDLIISKILVCLYNDSDISEKLVFRGGTALNKLFLTPPARYSEDIDFVQRKAEPIGVTIDIIKALLKPWLGEPKRKITERGAKLIYQYENINLLPAKVKIEINTTEHFQVLPLKYRPFAMESEWFSGSTKIITYEIEELMATKLRALYQRRKGRDLFDLWYVFRNYDLNVHEVIEIFQKYCVNDNIVISKELFQRNMELKRMNSDFKIDMNVLLPSKIYWNFEEAFEFVTKEIIAKI